MSTEMNLASTGSVLIPIGHIGAHCAYAPSRSRHTTRFRVATMILVGIAFTYVLAKFIVCKAMHTALTLSYYKKHQWLSDTASRVLAK